MKHKLNYTIEVGSKLTTLFIIIIFFILRIRERELVRWLLGVEVFVPRISQQEVSCSHEMQQSHIV